MVGLTFGLKMADLKMTVKPEEHSAHSEPVAPAKGKTEKYYPKLYIPIEPSWLDSLEPGKTISVVVTGNVTSVRASEQKTEKDNDDYYMERSELTMEVHTVEISKKGTKNDFDKLADT